ncbi:MAG: hypothetical protein RL662_2204 [Bacteroidota bacterium]|jgi:heat shock protein HslJ
MKKMIKMAFLLVAFVSLGMMAQSCKSKKETTATAKSDINGTWVLKTFNGQVASAIFKGSIPAMTIDLKEQRMFGTGGCNRFTGAFTYANEVLSAPNLASTMMLCVEENKEADFLAALGQKNEVSLINDVLTFKVKGKTVLEFVRGIDQALLQGSWNLEAIEGGDMNTLFTVKDKIPTLIFDTNESKLNGNAGCNNYGSSYQIEGASITVGVPFSTRMACPNMGGETLYTKLLEGTSVLNVTSDKLVLIRNGKAILTFAKSK